MKTRKIVPPLVLAGVICMVVLAACTKLTPQAKAALNVAAAMAKNRAAAFAAMIGKIAAKDKANSAKLADYVAEHSTELNQLSDAMSHLSDAVNTNGSKLDDTTRSAVWEEAKTSRTREKIFKSMMNFMTPSSDLDAHLAGLKELSQALTLLAQALPLSDGTAFVTSNANVTGGSK
jgi:septal ring factor EnvC (AmiA/AmiB activator)